MSSRKEGRKEGRTQAVQKQKQQATKGRKSRSRKNTVQIAGLGQKMQTIAKK